MTHAARRLVCGFAFGVAFSAVGCSSKSSPPPAAGGGTGGSTGGGGGGSTGTATGCANSQIKIVFSPMYSAFDGVHTFQIPALVDGIDASAITWSASDPSMVAIAADPDTGGAMITTQKSGQVMIIASAGTLCGSSLLNITNSTSDDWMIGSARYNSGVALTRLPRPGGGNQLADGGGGMEYACTNCHGDTATNNIYKTVQHTPEQAGGFSDSDLENIFRHGMVPQGGYFDASIVAYTTWQGFHQWTMTDDQARGVIVYLRALTPAAQTGASNFGGRFGDGGFPGRRRDGGGGPPGMPPAADAAAE